MSSLFDLTPLERASARNMSNMNKTLIAKIYSAAKAKGMTQSEIARRLDMDKSSISRLLQGRGNPTQRTIADIMAALEVQIDYTFPERRDGGNSAKRWQGETEAERPSSMGMRRRPVGAAPSTASATGEARAYG